MKHLDHRVDHVENMMCRGGPSQTAWGAVKLEIVGIVSMSAFTTTGCLLSVLEASLHKPRDAACGAMVAAVAGGFGYLRYRFLRKQLAGYLDIPRN